MCSDLLLPEEELDAYFRPGVMDPLRGVPVILVTSIDVDFVTNEGGELLRAAHLAAQAAKKAGIPQLVALVGYPDDHPDDYANDLNEAGAKIAFLDGMPDAPAHPYYALTQFVEKYCGPDTVMIMAPPGQNIAANPANITALLEAAKRFEVVVGSRDDQTHMKHSRSRRAVDAASRVAVADLAGVPFDTGAGIMALTAKGREVLLRTKDASMGLVTSVAHWAREWKIRTGSVELRFDPSARIAELEDANPAFLADYCQQARALLELARTMRSGSAKLSERQRQVYTAATILLEALAHRAA
jgi:hypothetical protein